MNFENHPCFDEKAKMKYGRLHLPVAPKCNIQCNFCNRKYDCVNESRPGVTSATLTPLQALEYTRRIIKINPSIKVVGIAGPGDPFANPKETMETLRLIRNEFPDMILCIATNGLELYPYIDELKELNVSHVTITINSVDPQIGSNVYAWIRYNKKVYRGIEGAELLQEKQLAAVKKLKELGIIVKINTILIPGINDVHVPYVAKKVSDCGANLLNIMPLHPTKDTAFENLPEPNHAELRKQREIAETYLPQMKHCNRCRADAVGLIGEENKKEYYKILNEVVNKDFGPNTERPFVGITSMEGVLINSHLGEAGEIMIYANEDGKPVFIESRKTPKPGSGDTRWEELGDILSDCYAVLVQGAGTRPKEILENKGIKVFATSGVIDETLDNFFNGKKLYSFSEKLSCGKGLACSGTGMGCG